MTPFMKFNDFIDNVYLPYVHRSFELSTYDCYVLDLKAIRKGIGNMRLGFIWKKHISRLLEEIEARGILRSTLHTYSKLLNAIFNYAVKNKNIIKNPCKGIHIKEGKSRAGAFTAEEINILLKHIKNGYPQIWLPSYIATNTGMRRGEILGLTWQNVDLVKKEILVCQSLCRTKTGNIYIKSPKTQSGVRIVAISDEVVDILQNEKVISKSEYVVPGYGKFEYMDPQYLTNYFGKAVRECKVTKRRFHDLRHTHASLLLAAGVSINVVSARLGHANIEITLKVYSHMLPGQQHAAAEAFSKGMKDGFIST